MIIDSNIIIYSAMPENNKIREYLDDIGDELSVSAISKIEVLGFHKLTLEEKILFEKFFNSVKIIQVDNSIIDRAVMIR